MANKSNDLRQALGDAFGDNFNSGTLKIYTAGNASLLATFTLAADAFAACTTAGVVAMNGLPDSVTAGNTGIAAVADLEQGIYTLTGLTVGESATQVIIDNTDINATQTVTLNSFSWTESGTA